MGPETGATGGTAIAGPRALADDGVFDDDDVVVVNTDSGSEGGRSSAKPPDEPRYLNPRLPGAAGPDFHASGRYPTLRCCLYGSDPFTKLMRVAAFSELTGPDGVSVIDQATPEPEHGEAVVSVEACAINRHDLWVLEGDPAMVDTDDFRLSTVSMSPGPSMPSATGLPLSSSGTAGPCP